jgi:hypothetical protein
MKRWLLFASLCFNGITVAQKNDSYSVEYVEFIKTVDINGTVQCAQTSHDESYIELLQHNAKNSGLHILKETIGRRNAKGELLTGAQATGLDIVLRGTNQLEANPEAKQAFINAAAAYEQRLSNPVTVTIDVDYGTTRFGTAYGTGVLGSTVSAVFTLSTVSMRQYAESLKTRNPVDADLYNNIPDTLYNTSSVVKPIPSGTLANLQAIGFRNQTETLPFGQAPSIGFNSNFPFDLDPSNGITSGLYDFDAIAVHEMGHALGFVSVIGSTGSARTWDIFRFRPGAVKDTNSFKTTQRVLTPGPSPSGGDQVFWDGSAEWEVSTATGAREGGDGQQASHWRDDAQRLSVPLPDRKIGIMDPTFGSGIRDSLSFADLKALRIMGWQVELPKLIYPPTGLKATSDYTTPTSIALSWNNPNKYFDGTAFNNFKTVIFRDEVKIAELNNGTAGALVQFNDASLTQYQRYLYRIINVSTANGDSGKSSTISITAGGSPYPDKGVMVAATSNGSTAVFHVQSPTRHDDNTLLNNLNGVYVYRSNLLPQSRIDSLVLTPSDTGKIFTFVDTPPSKLVNTNSYQVTFLGNAPFLAQGTVVPTPNLASGKINTTTYSESFETSRQSAVSDALWDSTNVSAHTGTFSLAILNYPNSANASVYIPQIKGNGTPHLSFWTICRTEAGKDFGKVELSKNRGKTWIEVLSLDESSHAEWSAGQNVWFKKDVDLSSYATDTILIRFRLVSDASTSKFGWLIDDITLSPVVTAVAEDFSGIPVEYSLKQNFPNPFNPSTKIQYALKEAGFVTVKVYDVLGKEIRNVVNTRQEAGWHAVEFDGSKLPSGVYIYQLQVNNYVETKKMLLIK